MGKGQESENFTYLRDMSTTTSRNHKLDELSYQEQNITEYLGRYYRGIWLAFRQYICGLLKKYLKASRSILDIGCGPLPSLVDSMLYENSLYCCVDISAKNLRYVKENSPVKHVVACDAEHVPFAPGVFDTIVCFGLLHHLYNPDTCMSEIRRVLSSKGYLLLYEPSSYWTGNMVSPHERGLSQEEIVAWVSSFQQYNVASYNNPKLRYWVMKICMKLLGKKRFNLAENAIWPLIFRIEQLLSLLRFKGTDYLVVARNN